jgi:hypothetical protein
MPTDESRIALPFWLPWATTACLAALVACLGELWIIEKARSQLLGEQCALAEAELKGAQNQLEAERIVDGRELSVLRAAGGPTTGIRVAWLLPPGGAAAPAFGVVAWESGGRRAVVRLSGLPAQGLDSDYQLWLDGPAHGKPSDCGVFHAPGRDDAAGVEVVVAGPVEPGCRFVLVQGAKGGARTLAEAEAGGSIVLASLPFDGNILGR